MKLFAVLPIATRNKRFLFIHGGLASSLQTIEDFNEQYGKTRVVDLDTSIGESLWSDPHYGTKPWIFNRARHGGVEFSEAVTQDFCRRNGIHTLESFVEEVVAVKLEELSDVLQNNHIEAEF
ncbi:hypothetical protein L5515_019275 [Caenorhabditis briggsae]|uniref:Calcineurin-like phosphoesterase domain-containing protein n=1 Tax=Caenorhabditis briggsae TaxID=6238 RepID=A0AAE9FLL1_CAEBR|nr:hypothetical protein L5515_019275 [Caenorhabditis briggsae]